MQYDIILNGFTEDMVFDRAQWQRLIHVANPVGWD